jgi:hypothetical protein
MAASLALLTGGRCQFVEGVLEAHGGLVTLFLRRGLPWMTAGAAAMTVGHVILGCDRACLARCRRHEHVHVRQYERWGPLMIPLYFLASFLAWRRGLDPYLDNSFEVEAYAVTDEPAA